MSENQSLVGEVFSTIESELPPSHGKIIPRGEIIEALTVGKMLPRELINSSQAAANSSQEPVTIQLAEGYTIPVLDSCPYPFEVHGEVYGNLESTMFSTRHLIKMGLEIHNHPAFERWKSIRQQKRDLRRGIQKWPDGQEHASPEEISSWFAGLDQAIINEEVEISAYLESKAIPPLVFWLFYRATTGETLNMIYQIDLEIQRYSNLIDTELCSSADQKKYKQMIDVLKGISRLPFISDVRARLMVSAHSIHEGALIQIDQTAEKGEPYAKIALFACGGAQAAKMAIAQALRERPDAKIELQLYDLSSKALIVAKESISELEAEFGPRFTYKTTRIDLLRDQETLITLFEDETIGVVEMLGLLDYFTDAQTVAILRIIKNIIHKNGFGRAIIANIEPFPWLIMIGLKGAKWSMIHRSIEHMIRLCNEAGYNDGEIKAFMTQYKQFNIQVLHYLGQQEKGDPDIQAAA